MEDENKILNKISQVEASVSKSIEHNKRELITTKYYNEFAIDSHQGPVILNDVFITIEKDKQGKMSYHFRWINEKNQEIEEKILIDEDGKVYSIPELKAFLENADINIEEVMVKNEKERGSLKAISQKATSKEMKEVLDNREKDEEKEASQIEEDLQEQGEDLDISKYRKIKDKDISRRMPEVFDKDEENGVAYSNKLNKFVIISKKDGKYEINDNIEPSLMTWKTIISIDEDGQKIERKVPHSLMKIPNNREKEIAVTLDNYGYIDIDTIQVTPCQERIARTVQMEGQGQEGKEEKEVTDTFEQEGNQLPDNLAHKKRELEKYGITEVTIEELMKIDIDKMLEDGAKKANVSVQGFKDYLKNADGKKLDEKITNAIDDVNLGYMHSGRDARNH